MNSVGIDLHRKRSHVAVLDGEGRQLVSRRIVNDPATFGWEWLADVLQDAGYELHLAHPMRTKAIASARQDRRRRCAHLGAPVARRPAAGGLHRGRATCAISCATAWR